MDTTLLCQILQVLSSLPSPNVTVPQTLQTSVGSADDLCGSGATGPPQALTHGADAAQPFPFLHPSASTVTVGKPAASYFQWGPAREEPMSTHEFYRQYQLARAKGTDCLLDGVEKTPYSVWEKNSFSWIFRFLSPVLLEKRGKNRQMLLDPWPVQTRSPQQSLSKSQGVGSWPSKVQSTLSMGYVAERWWTSYKYQLGSHWL